MPPTSKRHVSALSVKAPRLSATLPSWFARLGWVMPDLLVTDHAVERFQQRVRPCSADEARKALSTPPSSRCPVRLATGHGIALKGHVVMTVLPPDHFKRQINRHKMPRFASNYPKHQSRKEWQ